MNKALLKKIYALFLLLSLCCTTQQVLASHAVAMDLTYRCLGGNTYEITLKFYRDCIGIPAPNSPTININSVSCNKSLTLSVAPIPGTGQDVTPTCSSTVTTCHGGTFTGIQEWVYKGIVTLPMQCTDWEFSYSLCCRNAAITTISNPGTSTIYVYATLNNTIAPGNNSPTFANKPVPFVCVGQEYCFNPGATDADGDSIAYHLIRPKQTQNSTVNYTGSYTRLQPLTSVPPVAFDSTKGDICMTPTQLEVTVMAIVVTDYRNGVLIGSVERDMQVTVMNCNNNLPWLSGINGTNVFSMTACAGTPFCFDILSNDIDSGQTLTLTWSNNITGATFTSVGNPHPTGHFCWTPPMSAISNNPYCFTVTVKDNACPYYGSQVFSYCITVQGVNVNLGPDQQISCTDLATIYATTATPNSLTYLWSTGATTTYITAGVGTYWCTVTNGICSATDTVVVTSPFKPTAVFTNNMPNCLSDTVNFTDQSTSFGSVVVGWTWNFGDGSPPSNQQNPSHNYPGIGTYVVQLNVINSLGCTDSTTDTIQVLPPPIAAFTWVNACQGDGVTFTDQSTGATSWHWSFGDGQTSAAQNPVHTYTTPGSYNVILIVKNSIGCPDTISHSITAFPSPTANFNTSSVCVGSPTNFNDLSTGTVTSWKWKFGNGDSSSAQNPGETYGSVGTFTVTLVVTSGNGCIDTAVKPVIVHPLPVANAGPVITICSGSNGVLIASGGVTYSWTPGGGTNDTLIVNPTTYTSYTVTVTDVNGCSANDTTSVHINPLPVANAGADTNVCNGSSALLTASGGVGYKWSTGSTTSSITVTPPSTTSYTVTVTDVNGCTASDVVSVIVHNPPVITLANTGLCAGDTTTLNPGVAGAGYVWSTGETTSTIRVANTGSYSVTITDAFGCSSSASCTVTPGITVAINLSNTTICQGQTTTLDAGYPGSTYLWTPNGETTQKITVGTGGVYGVTVSGGIGCNASDSVTVIVHPLPTADAGPDQSVCTGSPVTLTASGGVTYLWFPVASTNQTISVTPPANTKYFVTVTDSFGCQASDSVSVSLNPLPVVAIAPVLVCSASNATLDAGNPGSTYLWSPNGETTESITTSTAGTYTVAVTNSFGCTSSTQALVIAGGTITSNPVVATICGGQSLVIDAGNPGYTFLWSTGSTTQTITVTTSGTYCVTVTSPGGCSATNVNTVTQNPVPIANFIAPSNCLAGATQFTDQSSVSSGTINAWRWDFGDGQISNQQSPSYLYTSAGTYSVTLQVTTNNGCQASLVHVVTIYPLPVANFSTNATCNGDTSFFADQSAVSGGTITNWSWNFGDNTSTTGKDVNHLYNLKGQYSVSLTVTTSQGCTNSITNPQNIYPLPAPIIAAPSVCLGLPVAFADSDTSASVITNSLWTFGDGTTSASLNVSHTYSGSGLYNVKLLTANQFGCTSTVTTSVQIYPKPVANFNSANACLGVQISFGNRSTIDGTGNSLLTYDWSFGDNFGHSTQTNPSYVYPFEGTFNVVLSTISDHGCTNTITKAITVYPLPVVSVSGITTGCGPFKATLNDSSKINSGSIVGWLWDFGDGNVSTNQNAGHTYDNPGNYTITLTVSSDKGCVATATGTEHMVVYPSAKADFTMNPTSIDITNPVVHFTNLSSNFTSLKWDFGDGDSSKEFSPSHLYKYAGDYTIVLVANNSYNCPARMERKMDVNPVSTLFAPNAFTPNADGTNDVWKPAYTDMTDIKVWIFNRWGEMLTHWDGLDGYWDGVYNGRPVQQDVYVYQIEGTGQDGKFYKWTGDITLVR